MKKMLFYALSGWHHGKGSKFTRQGNLDLALKHYQSALKYAMRSKDDTAIPIELECIARTFVRAGDYEQAQKYALESLTVYKKLEWMGNMFEENVRRITALLMLIEKREPLSH